jgi:Holliday junction resolvase-like predicted endonuclease
VALARFTLNGTRYEVSSDVAQSRLEGVVPEAIREHAVQVNGVWYPVKQAFEVAVGVPRAEFISHTARRHLAALGFPLMGEIESRDGTPSVPTATTFPPESKAAPATADGEWHTEANVQAAVVSALAARGYRIVSVANTATKEHGIDVIASHEGTIVGVEVKGFPSKNYADPSRAHEQKRTSPSTQAGHWYSQAVLAAMRLRGKEPNWRSVIALPDFGRYRDLYSETIGSLEAAQIDVWWIDEDGTVELD